MNKKPNEQQLAKDLYLHTDKTQSEIADILNITRKTLYLWIKNGSWQEMKIAARQAPGLILQDIYNHIDAINRKVRSRDEDDRCPTMEEVEKLRKLIGMTSNINKKHTGAYIGIIEELTFFIAKKDVALAQQVTQFADRFIKGTLFNKNFNMEQNVTEIEAALAEEDEHDHSLPLQTAPQQGNNESMCVHDESISTVEDVASKPVIISEVKEDIHNDQAPVLPTEKLEENVTIPPLSPHPVHTTDYWTEYLEQRFQISRDPYITRKNGITIIRHGSPLLNRPNGLYF